MYNSGYASLVSDRDWNGASAWPVGSLGLVCRPFLPCSGCPQLPLPHPPLLSPPPLGRGLGWVGCRVGSDICLPLYSCFMLAPPEKVEPAPPSTTGLAGTGGAPGAQTGSGSGCQGPAAQPQLRGQVGYTLSVTQLFPMDSGEGSRALQGVLVSPSWGGGVGL